MPGAGLGVTACSFISLAHKAAHYRQIAAVSGHYFQAAPPWSPPGSNPQIARLRGMSSERLTRAVSERCDDRRALRAPVPAE